MVSRPGEGKPVGGLPEEWGRIVIPDDAAELAELAEEVQFELGVFVDVSQERRQRRLPFIVVAVTLAIALVSLFTVPWLGRAGQVTPPRPAVSTSVTSSSEPDCGDRANRCASSSGVSASSG